MSIFSKTCSVYPTKPEQECFAPNPNPLNFKVISTEQIGDNVVAQIKYPDCTNYDGNKICLFKGVTVLDIKSRKVIDPHFADNTMAPFARFKPTQDGWEAAKLLASIIR